MKTVMPINQRDPHESSSNVFSHTDNIRLHLKWH